MKSCQSLKEDAAVPRPGGMSQEEGRRTQVSQAYFHSSTSDLNLSSKLYKREGGGKPYSVLVDNKLAAKIPMGDQVLGQLPPQHVMAQQQQQYYREGAAGQEGGPQGTRAGNRGPSEDSDEDEEEDEDEEGVDGEEGAFKREQIIVEVNLNNQTLHVSKGDNKSTPPVDASERHDSEEEDDEEEESMDEEDEEE